MNETDINMRTSASTLAMIESAVRNRWAIPEAVKENAAKIAAKVALEGKSDRDKLRAIQVLAALDRDNVDALGRLWDRQRTHEGKASQQVKHDFSPDDLRAAADALDPRTGD